MQEYKTFSIIEYFTASPRVVVENDTINNTRHNTVIHNIRSPTGIGWPAGHSPGRDTMPVANARLGCHIKWLKKLNVLLWRLKKGLIVARCDPPCLVDF